MKRLYYSINLGCQEIAYFFYHIRSYFVSLPATPGAREIVATDGDSRRGGQCLLHGHFIIPYQVYILFFFLDDNTPKKIN